MANTYQSSKAQTLTCFLKRINQCNNSELLRKEANQLLTNVCPSDIATAEQNLIDDGYSAQAVQLLSATFMLMGIPAEHSNDIKTKLPANAQKERHLLILIKNVIVPIAKVLLQQP